MKIFFAIALVLFVSAAAFGQARPGDSIILESKTVAPGIHPGSGTDTAAYLYVKMYLTSQDSLTYLALPLKEVSTSGGAYGILGYPRSFYGVITPLSPYFRQQTANPFGGYNSSSPDSFLLAAGFDPVDPATIAPPFPVRTAIWEIKFDSVWNNPGTFELDSATLFGLSPTFTDTGPTDYPVNFVKSVITVQPLPDARDSIILESKTVAPGSGHPYTTVTVYITNKDSLTYMTLPLIAKSTSGGAYGILPKGTHGLWTFPSIITPLRPSLRFIQGAATSRYNGSSPDTFLVGAGFDPAEPDSSIEPPNAVRKAVWQIKFDTIRSDLGAFELDSTFFFYNMGPTFTNMEPRDMPTNFVKSVITVRAVPDARDSVILESKTVVPGAGHPYTTVTVYITNKDSLTYMALSLLQTSISGGAYGTLTRAGSTGGGIRTFGSVITNLTPTLRYVSVGSFNRYNSSSPDTFLVGAGFDPGAGEPDSSIEPPNATRKAVWQIKFDTIFNNLGTFKLDTVSHPNVPAGPAQFTNTVPADMPANFVKSVITVAYPKGDLNQDVALSPADVVWILNCVMLGTPPPVGASACDLNCDGQNSPADVVLELNAVFLQEAFPC